MNDEFISDAEVEKYERRVDPARRSVQWSLAAVAAAFVLIGGAYAFGLVRGTDAERGGFLASLFGSASEEQGETFPLWSAGREAGTSFAQDSDERAISSGTCGYERGVNMTDRLDESDKSDMSDRSDRSGEILISEIAWMGTEEGAQYEWIELANVGDASVSISGWSVVDKDEQIQNVFRQGASIPVGGFFLLARSADRVGSVRADARYTGNLKNEDEALRLFNGNCEVADEVVAAPKWPAGESSERRTMERNFATRTWHTSTKVGGTPKAANTSGWSNIFDHPEDTPVVTSPSMGVFTTTSAPASAEDGSNMTDRSNMSDASGAVVISEVMAGKEGVTNWDFVELWNRGTNAVNLTGWSVKRRSSTGNESALVSASRFEGVVIPAGGYILLAHPDYAGVTDVVWPKSYALAYTNNAVVLYHANGTEVSEVSWTEIPKGQSYAKINDVWVLAAPTPKAAP